MWFWLVSLSGLIFTIRTLLGRIILRKEKDTLAYAFVQQVVAALLILPLALIEWQWPQKMVFLLFLFLVGVWDSLSTFLITESLHNLEVSLRTIIYQFRIVWLIFLGNIFLGETLNWQKILGGVLVFLGVVLATYTKGRAGKLWVLWERLRNGQSTQKEKGVLITLSAALSTSFQVMAVKYLLDYFSPSVMLFGLTATSSLVYVLIVGKKKERLNRLPKLTYWNAALGPLAGWLFWVGSDMSEVTKTVPIANAFAVLTVIFGIIFLKEREKIWQKILGSLLAVAGVILVKIS